MCVKCSLFSIYYFTFYYNACQQSCSAVYYSHSVMFVFFDMITRDSTNVEPPLFLMLWLLVGRWWRSWGTGWSLQVKSTPSSKEVSNKLKQRVQVVPQLGQCLQCPGPVFYLFSLTFVLSTFLPQVLACSSFSQLTAYQFGAYLLHELLLLCSTIYRARQFVCKCDKICNL